MSLFHIVSLRTRSVVWLNRSMRTKKRMNVKLRNTLDLSNTNRVFRWQHLCLWHVFMAFRMTEQCIVFESRIIGLERTLKINVVICKVVVRCLSHQRKHTHAHTHTTHRGVYNYVTALEAYKNRTYPTTSWRIPHSVQVLFLGHRMTEKWEQFNMNVILFWIDFLWGKFIKEVAFRNTDGEYRFGRFYWLFSYKKIYNNATFLGGGRTSP